MSVRQIVLDTETTGLDPGLGHRIIELAGVELVNRRLTGNHFHRYLNPERDSDAGALQVHGLTREFLHDKPKFAEVAEEFLRFIAGAELIIHNAPFDVAFLDAELAKVERAAVAEQCRAVTDTLRLAKELHPGKRNNLDALCDRYAVDHSARTVHGALLDAQLLAEVYLAMTRGQDSLAIDVAPGDKLDSSPQDAVDARALEVLYATEQELLAHRVMLEEIKKASGGVCLWETESSTSN
jgi:DNA polymerase III subunit epsilon